MPTNEPTTREGWLENNRLVMEAEGYTEAEIFINRIETKLALPPELRTEYDEKLGDAYIMVLNEGEDKGEQEYNPFLALQPEDLMEECGVSRLDAAVIFFLGSIEYWPANIPTPAERRVWWAERAKENIERVNNN